MKIVIDIPEEKWQRVIDGTSCLPQEILDGIPLEKVLEDIKAEIRQGVSDFANENGDIAYGFVCAEEIIDKHIADMRGTE